MSHILIIEDDIHIRDFISKGLNEAGHTVEMSDSVEDALVKGDYMTLDLIIVDIMLKTKKTGIDFIHEYKEKFSHVPIIILSARDRVEDKVLGLTNGADDYLTKPFSLSELKARVENLLRRTGKRGEKTTYEYQDLKMNLLTREVTRGEKNISLQRREFMMLEYFMENIGLVLGKMMILERIWGYDFDPQTNVVDVLISRLRNKIDKGFEVQLIHTVRGVGYVFKKK